MAKKKRQKKKGSWFTTFLLTLVFLAGAGILFYPTISDLRNQYRNRQLISEYSSAVSEIEEEDYSKLWEDARAYNREHTVNTIVDVFDEENEEDYVMSHPYDSILNPTGNNVMGYIEIPKIDVKLAIYHGVGKKSLENGCGHIEGTSLPIGGEGTHAVLSAHRGLPSAKLFTDLDQLEEGDLFFLTILGEKLAYRVDQIKVVLPEETEDLAIEEGKDLVTLVTCTPYGVNSHRMLVRGVRTEYVEEEAPEESGITVRNPIEGMDRSQKLLMLGLAVFMGFLIVMSIVFKIQDHRKAKRKRMQQDKKEE